MTKVSREILDEVQEILDVRIPQNLHPVFTSLVEIIAKLVGSDEGILETVISLEMRVKKLEAKIIENELQNRK